MLALAIPLAGCGGGKNGASDASAAQVDPQQAQRGIGGFDVQLDQGTPASAEVPAVPPQAAFLGAVRSAPPPPTKTWTVTAQEGPCRLEEPRIPFCNPACSESVCTETGCVRDPEPRSAGTVTLEGVALEGGATSVTLPPAPPRFTYLLPPGVRLAYPPFTPGAQVELRGQGGDLGTFTLRARGISPLVLADGGVPQVRPGMPFALRWQPGTAAEQARIQVSMDLSFHAGTKGRIQCEVLDSGSMEISASMLSRLLALGTAGFPKVVLTRSSVGSANLPAGRVKLTVFAELLNTLSVEGQTSCVDDKDCPSGNTCSPSMLCR